MDGCEADECVGVAVFVREWDGDAGRSADGDDRGGWPAPKAHASTLPGLGEELDAPRPLYVQPLPPALACQ